jgi:hypothetical protein
MVLAGLGAAATAAAQLGLGYGLGIITWVVPAGTAPEIASGAWTSSLAWATWVAATSVVAGAVFGDRMGGKVQSGRFVRVAWRVVIALSAAIGGLVAVPLVGVPARNAQVVNNFAPHLLAGIFATVGIVLGLLVALVAMTSRAVAANVFASTLWLWILAAVAIVDGVASGRNLAYTPLAVWKFTDTGPVWHSYYIPGALLMLGSALLIGGLAAFPAAGRGAGRLGVAISGAVGPLLVAIAYVMAAPSPSEAPPEQMSAFYSAPYMVIAGLAGSVLVAAVGSVPHRSDRAERATAPVVATAIVTQPPRPALGSSMSGPAALPSSGTASVPASPRVYPGGISTP